MKVAFITSASLVTANPYTKAYFSVLRSHVSALPSPAHREVYKATKTTRQGWPLLWPTKEDFFSSALCGHSGFPTRTVFFFFFLLNSQSLGSIAESGTLMFFINVLSYHDVNGIGLVFLPIFFLLVHGHRRMYLPCVSCPEMMSEDILSLVYTYLSENV